MNMLSPEILLANDSAGLRVELNDAYAIGNWIGYYLNHGLNTVTL